MAMSHSEQFMHAFAHDEPPPFDLMLNKSWNTLWQLREHLVLRARVAASERARSYRNFLVGGAALLSSTKPEMLRSLGRTDHIIYTGSNWKLANDERNTCAEQEIIAQIRQQRHMFPPQRIFALVVAGEAQDEPDHESGVFTPTLHPCAHCRHLLVNVPEMKKDTIIITVSRTTETMEIMTFMELLRIHEVKNSKQTNT